MPKIKLNNNWEWEDDSGNGRSIIRDLNNGNEWYYQDDGTFQAPAVNTPHVNSIKFASQYDDSTDGIESAVQAAGDNGYVWLGAGGGSGPNGEYMVAPGSNDDGITGFGYDDVTLAGNGTIKLDTANAANDYRSVVGDATNWVYKGFTIDGSRSNLTDGGQITQQLGFYGNGTYDKIIDVTIKNCQYGGIRARTADGTINRGIEAINNGGSCRWDKSGSNNAERTIISDFKSIDCGGANNNNFGGLVLGDGFQRGAVSNCVIKPVAGEGAFRLEQSDHVTVSNVRAEGVVSVVGPVTNSKVEASIDGDYLRVDGGIANCQIEAVVKDPPEYGAFLTGVSRTNEIDVSVMGAAQTTDPDAAIILEGGHNGGELHFNVRGGNNGSYPAVLLRSNGTNDTIGWMLSGHVEAPVNTVTYAVEAADSNQTALVDGVVAENIGSGVVNNPGGLTVGDTASL